MQDAPGPVLYDASPQIGNEQPGFIGGTSGILPEAYLIERKRLHAAIREAKGRNMASKQLERAVAYWFEDLWRTLKVVGLLTALVTVFSIIDLDGWGITFAWVFLPSLLIAAVVYYSPDGLKVEAFDISSLLVFALMLIITIVRWLPLYFDWTSVTQWLSNAWFTALTGGYLLVWVIAVNIHHKKHKVYVDCAEAHIRYHQSIHK
jgi:hypothetical protein